MEYRRRTGIPVPAREVFEWHARPGALERLTPPWSSVEVVARRGGIEAGARVVLRMPLGPLSLRWVAEHTDYVEGQLFRDVQVEGPFARWVHTHRFIDTGDGASLLEDHVEYAVRFGRLGALFDRPLVRPMLERMFAYRHRITLGDLAAHARYRDLPRQRFLIGGADTALGGALLPYLTTGGHTATMGSLSYPEAASLPVSLEVHALHETTSTPPALVCVTTSPAPPPARAELEAARASGTRVVELRVAGDRVPRGGALERDEILDAILHVAMRDDIEGPVEPSQLLATGFTFRTRREEHARPQPQ